jgi:hypothetical protein
MIYGALYTVLLSMSGLIAGLRPYRNTTYYIVLAVLFLFVAYRYEVGCDWTGYLNIYNLAWSVELDEALKMREPLFWAANVLLHHLGLKYEYINVVAALVYFGGFHVIARRQPDQLGFLILSFPILILHLPMSGIRQAMALGMLCLAYVSFIDRKPLRYLILVAMASGFHASALSFLAILPFMFGQLSWTKALICSIAAAPILFLVTGNPDFEVYTTRYLGDGPEAAGALFRTGALALVGSFFLLFLKHLWRQKFPQDFNLIMIGSVVMIAAFPLALISSVAGDRLGHYFTIFQMIILARVPYMIRNPVAHPAPYLAAGAILIVWIQFSRLFELCYIPYSNWLFS